MHSANFDKPASDQEAIPLCQQAEANEPRAWELIDHGRYQPRRIRGSFRGRELG